MKKYLMGILVSMIAFAVNAQKVVEKQISLNPTSSLDLKLEFADTIQVKQSKDNTLRITATVNINDNQHNDKYELITSVESGFVEIKAKIHDMESIRVPCKNHQGSNYESHDGKCVTMDISYMIEVPAIADLHLKTINGNIIIDHALNTMSIESISGFIDLTVPVTSNLNFNLKTITGGIYTNPELHINMDNYKGNPGGNEAQFKTGTGGNMVKLSTISNDIFVR
ncbi:MAG: hypothetical protein PHF97_11285 [Bacteroidales bacterium]|nr:hypothetical protein [Bacteroidales bacterium]